MGRIRSQMPIKKDEARFAFVMKAVTRVTDMQPLRLAETKNQMDIMRDGLKQDVKSSSNKN